MDPSGSFTRSLPPTVFQCSSCKAILADHLNFKVGHEQLGLLAFQGVCNVFVDSCVQVGNLTAAGDSRFQALSCTECGTVVGRTFVSLPSMLEVLQDKFCLEVSQLQSFELGKTDVSFPEAEHADGDAAGTPAVSGEILNGADLKERIDELEAEMTKVQHILLLHQEGLTSLNSHLGLDMPPENETKPTNPQLQS